MRKILACLLLSLLLLPLSGCWNYRGLDEMTIVSAIAIDKDEKNGNYKLSFEFIDISGPVKQKGPSGKIIEAEGKTIFDALRNAKKRSENKLYFGHTQALIISQTLAKNEDLSPLLDWLMRDGEVRETMYMSISQEPTAADVLRGDGLDQQVIGIKLRELLDEDNETTGSTVKTELYQSFDNLNTPGNDLALSAVWLGQNGEEKVCEINGLAAFKGERLAGFLSPEETKYYLAATNKLKGGVITFSTKEGEKDDATLEIFKCKTRRTVMREGDKPKIRLEINLTVVLEEYMRPFTDLSVEKFKELDALISRQVKTDVEAVIRKVQKEFGADIFGFGELIHKKDDALWKDLSEDWEKHFQSLVVEVEVKPHILGSSYLNRS